MKLLFILILVFSLNISYGNESEEQTAPAVQNSMFTDMLPKVMKDQLAEILKDNPFSKMEKEAVKTLAKSMVKGQKFGEYLDKNPKALDCFVTWLRDKKAMPAFLSIVNKPDKMKIFSGIFIFVFIVSFLFNLKNSKSNILVRLVNKLCIFVCATTVNLGSFYFIFRDELDPTIKIIRSFI